MDRSSFDQLFERAREVIKKFSSHDAKPWSASDKMLDFTAHVGRFGQAVMEREGLKPKTEEDELEKELGILFFILFDISETYGIDLGSAFGKFIRDAEDPVQK